MRSSYSCFYMRIDYRAHTQVVRHAVMRAAWGQKRDYDGKRVAVGTATGTAVAVATSSVAVAVAADGCCARGFFFSKQQHLAHQQQRTPPTVPPTMPTTMST